ncbi:MAG: hypothetical protein C5B51_08365 [Terriglobia bacterium]|nr:MAG: hypothetical protein C5B51_08365 [Terriglobia bacterium]
MQPATSLPAEKEDAPLKEPSSGEDAIPEALYETLQGPSVFGRMLLLNTMRTPETDRYDAGYAERFGTPLVERALRGLHLDIFISWLSLSLQHQKADISIYLNLTPVAERPARLKELIPSAVQAIPSAAKPPERQLFLQDLKIVLALFRYDY